METNQKEENLDITANEKDTFNVKVTTVLFFDIVGFTKGSGEYQQAETILSLVDHVQKEYQESIEKRASGMLFSATGDGLAIALTDDEDTPDRIMEVLEYIMSWTKTTDVTMRCGIYSGALIVYTGIGGRTEFCGEAVNSAKRIMDVADDHILCSVSTLKKYKNKTLINHGWINQKPKMYYVKHLDRVHVTNIYKARRKKAIYGRKTPPDKYLSEKFRYARQKLKGKQNDILKANKLCCVAITAVGFLQLIKKYTEDFPNMMVKKNIIIYTPLKKLIKFRLAGKPGDAREDEWEEAKKVYHDIKKKSKELGFNIELFNNLDFFPTFGVLGFDHEEDDEFSDSKGVEQRKIRIVWYIWGEDADKSPYADFIHPGDDYLGDSEYDMFVRAINSLKARVDMKVMQEAK